MMLQTVGTQVVNLGGFLILGWLLDNDAFGLFALVTTIGTLVAIVRQFGIRAVIIQRFDRIQIWCNPAIWMSFALGIIGALTMCAAAPIGVVVYDRPELAWLIVIYAAGVIPSSLTSVPEAILAAQMRFRLIAIVEFGWIALLTVLMVIFALLDFGVYSFVLPQPLVQTVRLILVWRASKPAFRMSPQVRRWKHLFVDSVLVTLNSMATWITGQCDTLILALFHPESVVGVYFFGYRLSNRVILLFLASFRNVLLPVLSELKHDIRRQEQALVRVTAALATFAGPVCVLQILLARPAFELALPADKVGAASVIEVLSIAAYFRLVSEPAQQLLIAQRRLKILTSLSIFMGTMFLCAAFVGAASGAEVAMATAVTLFFVFAACIRILVAIRNVERPVRQLMTVLFTPAAIAAAAFAIHWTALRMFEVDNLYLQLAVPTIIVAVVHLIAWRILRPESTALLFSYVQHRFNRWRDA